MIVEARSRGSERQQHFEIDRVHVKMARHGHLTGLKLVVVEVMKMSW